MHTMNKHSLFRFLSILAVMVLAITAAGPAAAQSAQPVDVAEQCYQGQLATNAQTGLINSAGSRPGQSISAGLRANSGSPEAAARAYLVQCGSLFGLTDQAAELTVKNQTQDAQGRSVIRFQQVYQGVPVFSGEFLVQVDRSGNVVVANGDITPAQELDVRATFDPEAARQTALELVAQAHKVDAGSLKAGSPSLNIYNPALLGLSGALALVWRVDVTPQNIAPIREVVLVDAASGGVAYHFNNSDSALQRYTYDMFHGTDYAKAILECADPTTCTAPDNAVYDAHYYAGATYDYYFSTFGRDSLDNAGKYLISYTNYGISTCNAYWNGFNALYGGGCSIVQDDIVGHEFSHGVIDYTSNLTYSNQSGAIDESWSDIMGKGVAFSLGNDAGDQRWLIGGDVPPPDGPFRDMKDPPAYGQPDKMSSPYWSTDYNDNGGVHTNSGVGNKTAYLMTDGDTFNGYTVTGIGWAKTAQIFYYTNVYLLTASSNYAALGTALNQACANLTGSYGITSGDCANVQLATYATEIISVVPTPVSPSGLVTTSTPKFSWNAVSGATQYWFQAIKGAKVIFNTVVPASVCAGTLCSKKSPLTLGLGTYQWNVRAYVGGAWRPYSGYLYFTMARPGSVMNGYWSNGSWSNFTVVKYNQVKNFTIIVNLNWCGVYRITHRSPTPTISSKRFSFSGPFYAKGTFNSITSAHGTTGLNRFGPLCGYYWYGGPFDWSSTWRYSVVPTFTAEAGVGPDLAEPAPQEQSDITVERVK